MIISFDLDGTLIDSFSIHWDAMKTTGKKLGIPVEEKDKLLFAGAREEEGLKIVHKGISQEKLDKFRALKDKTYNDNQHNITSFPDTMMTLHELSKKAKLLVLSNSYHAEIIRSLNFAGINPLIFDKIIGADEVDHPKPSADEILLAEKLEKHDVDYHVGDTVVDMQTGNSAGVKAIGVTTGITPREMLEKQNPFKVIDHLSELLKIIK